MCTFQLQILVLSVSRIFPRSFDRLTLLLLYSTTALSGCWLLNEPNRAGGFFHKNISADFFTSCSFIKVTMTTFDRYKLQYFRLLFLTHSPPFSLVKRTAVLWIQIHRIWIRIQDFGPIWIRIQVRGYTINFEINK